MLGMAWNYSNWECAARFMFTGKRGKERESYVWKGEKRGYDNVEREQVCELFWN